MIETSSSSSPMSYKTSLKVSSTDDSMNTNDPKKLRQILMMKKKRLEYLENLLINKGKSELNTDVSDDAYEKNSETLKKIQAFLVEYLDLDEIPLYEVNECLITFFDLLIEEENDKRMYNEYTALLNEVNNKSSVLLNAGREFSILWSRFCTLKDEISFVFRNSGNDFAGYILELNDISRENLTSSIFKRLSTLQDLTEKNKQLDDYNQQYLESVKIYNTYFHNKFGSRYSNLCETLCTAFYERFMVFYRAFLSMESKLIQYSNTTIKKCDKAVINYDKSAHDRIREAYGKYVAERNSYICKHVKRCADSLSSKLDSKKEELDRLEENISKLLRYKQALLDVVNIKNKFDITPETLSFDDI